MRKKKRKIYDDEIEENAENEGGDTCNSFISLPLNFRRKALGTSSVPI